MNFSKKKVLIVALAVCLVAILSIGTLAWYNYTDEVTNKFMVADSDQDGAPDFAIDVKESATDGDGNKVDADNDGEYDLTDTGNTYTDLAPGDLIFKDPVVTNTGDYAQWVRVNLLISKDFADQIAEEQGVAAEAIDMATLLPGFDAAMWSDSEFNDTAYTDYYIYAYYYAGELGADEAISVFTGVQIPETFTQEDMVYGTDGFQIIVKADAIQSENIAGPAKSAFATAAWEIGTAYDL